MTNSTSSGGDHRRRVIVVGAGPVGLFAALLLAQAGIAVDVMEKDTVLNKARNNSNNSNIRLYLS
jgi:2-polyprenyl-6-methoxyphenol hydroxylase-like FAD-dependent oxidoreductase